MSAKNWRNCPRCLAIATAEKARARQAAQAAYGKLPPDEWAAMQAEADKPTELEDTLREDYELATSDDGTFYVSYCCSCQECDFAHSFKHEQKLNVLGKKR